MENQVTSDMAVDSDYDERTHNMTQHSTPEESMDEKEQTIHADNFEAMQRRYMVAVPDQEVEVESTFTWDIEGWRSLPRKSHSPVFEIGGRPWKILFFPAGNNQVDSASVYLEHGYEAGQMPQNWYACVQFMLVLWNPNDPTIYIHSEANHRFTTDEGDWGFTRYAEKNKIFATRYADKDRPLIENDSAKMTAYVRIYKDPTGVLWHNFNNYDSKKETGLIGLRNQGATCYLNSLLQSLYFTNAFRAAVYKIPTEQETDARNSSAWALQRLFYRLQTEPAAVSTAELTQSFGWESRQIFEQQDVQELSRILMEKMEEKMKGTDAENTLAQMFVGKMKTYLKCIDVDYESSRIEDFWDLQLNVSGCKTVEDSFKNYVEVETLEGDNKYHAEGFGLQDAKKGVIFESFPTVLHLQLKRFEYDFQRDMMVKVNDRYEFPEVLDVKPYLSDTADMSESYIYCLHGVLVHSGDMNAGHYYAFIKPEKNGDFYKFDDDRVTRATKKEAMDENFGGDYGQNPSGGDVKMQNPFSRTWSTKRSMSAYMLVYVRQSRLDQVLLSSDQVNAPEHLPIKLAEEKAILERRRKDREEAHLYMDIQIATFENFQAWQGFDLADWDDIESQEASAPRHMRVLKTLTVEDLLTQLAEETSSDAKDLRPWVIVKRQNGTRRPDSVIQDTSISLEECCHRCSHRQGPFKLWLEDSSKTPQLSNGQLSNGQQTNGTSEKKDILLFLKYFDIEAQELKGVGHVFMSPSDRVSDMTVPILTLMGWYAGAVDLKLYEEIKVNFVELMKPTKTLQQSELQDGDIICFQKAFSEADQTAFKDRLPLICLEAPLFYDYLANRIQVHFGPRPGGFHSITTNEPEQALFSLSLSRKDTYDSLSLAVADHLSKLTGTTINPTHLRFTTINAQTNKPRLIVKKLAQTTLASILLGTTAGGYSGQSYSTQSPDSLFYEILDMSLTDLEQHKLVRIYWLPEGTVREEQHDILVPKQSTMLDVLDVLRQRVPIPDESLSAVRFLEVHSCQIQAQIQLNTIVSSLNDFVIIYAELQDPEEKNVTKTSTDKIICCFHFDKDPLKSHGIPFAFVVKEGELFKDTKERLSKRSGIKGKAFEKIKFALINDEHGYTKPDYLEDDDVISEKWTAEDQLGLDHPNKNKNTWAQHEKLNIR